MIEKPKNKCTMYYPEYENEECNEIKEEKETSELKFLCSKYMSINNNKIKTGYCTWCEGKKVIKNIKFLKKEN